MFFFSHVSFSEIPTNLDVVEIAMASSPLAFVSAKDGSGCMFIVERAGVIKVYQNGVVLAEPFLDISAQVSTVNEQGLLGLAFSPDYALNGYFFIYYSFNDTKINVGAVPMRLVRFEVSADPNIADENTMQVITEISQSFTYHKGGNINFGPNGYLYIGTGDDGSLTSPQVTSDVNGKILRIDVTEDLIFKNEFGNDVNCGSPQNYLIPDDNPFVDDPIACQAVFLLGLRNPWRWSFDKATGHLYIGDVGGITYEEVREVIIPEDAGGNLGWPCIEGEVVLRQACVDDINHLINPFFTYERVSGQGQSVVGGYVYRGQQIPELQGMYLFNDIYREEFYFSESINGQWQTELWSEQVSRVVSYGEDEAGELYLVSISGSIYRIIKN